MHPRPPGRFFLRPADSTGLITGVDCLIPGAYMDKILRVLDRAAVGVVELHRLGVSKIISGQGGGGYGFDMYYKI